MKKTRPASVEAARRPRISRYSLSSRSTPARLISVPSTVMSTSFSCCSTGMDRRIPIHDAPCIGNPPRLARDGSHGAGYTAPYAAYTIVAHESGPGAAVQPATPLLPPASFRLAVVVIVHPADHHLFPGLLAPARLLGGVRVVGVPGR